MRGIRSGRIRIYWAPLIAVPSLPARSELPPNAGLDLTGYGHRAVGWKIEQQRIRIPSVVLNATAERPGSWSVADSSIEFYEVYHPESKLVRGTLAAGTPGNIVRMPYGEYGEGATPLERCEVWPVTTMVHMDTDWAAEASEDAAAFVVPFAITGYPILSAIVPTLTGAPPSGGDGGYAGGGY